jgi:CRISP-associated protein Cas1
MRTLYVDRKDSEIGLDKSRLWVKIPGARQLYSVPTRLVDSLVISAPVSFSSTLIHRLTSAGISAIFLNPQKAESCTATFGLGHNATGRRLAQYHAVSEPALRAGYAKEIVVEKIRAQRQVLLRAALNRQDKRYQLRKSSEQLANAALSLGAELTLASLRGIEGAAAAAYFKAYQCLFPPSLDFTSRNRRPPLDPVNVALSLTYSLLHAEAVRVLFSAGFDPFLGVYHEPVFGRESLACDLVECYRPMAEHWVWRLFADEKLRVEHFTWGESTKERPCVLGKAGRAHYYSEFACESKLWRRLMRRTATSWRKRLEFESQLIEKSL